MFKVNLVKQVRFVQDKTCAVSTSVYENNVLKCCCTERKGDVPPNSEDPVITLTLGKATAVFTKAT